VPEQSIRVRKTLPCLICLLWLLVTGTRGLAYDNRHVIEDATAGDPEAQYTLAHLYHKGLGGVDQSTPDAIMWMRRAAEADHMDGMYDLAMLLLGDDNPGKKKEALFWLEMSAEMGHGGAQLALGRAYGLHQPDKAVRWLKKALENGYSNASEYLDELCDCGLTGCELSGCEKIDH